jgi:Spy/CpxP family protein refolding chaperone
MKKTIGIGLAAVLCCVVAAGVPAMAQSIDSTAPYENAEPTDSPESDMFSDDHGAMHGGGHGAGMRGEARGSVPLFWRATLSDDQRAEIGLSMLRLQQRQALVEARIALKKAEIAQIVASDESSDARLQSAVDDLIALERAQTLDHYRHLMEVRQLLTPKQRLSFDLGLISGDAHGLRHGGGHGH